MEAGEQLADRLDRVVALMQTNGSAIQAMIDRPMPRRPIMPTRAERLQAIDQRLAEIDKELEDLRSSRLRSSFSVGDERPASQNSERIHDLGQEVEQLTQERAEIKGGPKR